MRQWLTEVAHAAGVRKHGVWHRRLAGQVGFLLAAVLLCAGCKSDFNQQLLERELRMQEDQIYQLQDDLQDKCSRLDRVASENQSLKRQLGIADGGGPTVAPAQPGRFLPTPSGAAAVAPPVLVPPTVDDVPAPAATLPPPSADGPRFGAPSDEPPPSFRGAPATPTLEGVPPLPDEPVLPGGGVNGTSAETEADPSTGAAQPGAVRPLSHEESLAVESRLTHLVLNRDRTACFDGDGDGACDGLAIVFEPRDADERLVTAAGDVSIAVYEPPGAASAADAAGEGVCIARWEIPATEAGNHFRRTSRNRGLHFVKPWPGPKPAADHVRVFVRMTAFDGTTFETEGTVPTK